MYKQYLAFNKKIVLIGFGTIGKAILPLIFRHIGVSPKQIIIITKNDDGQDIASEFGVKLVINAVTRENHECLLGSYAQDGDFILNLSVDVSSAALIQYCQRHNILYLDTCIEPWEGGYVDSSLPASSRSNYAMRETVLALRNPGEPRPTAVVTHGANPGLVSHFLKRALINIAIDTGHRFVRPQTQSQWAQLAQDLSIKVIHIAERDTQISDKAKRPGEFVNTWSIDGFISEASQPVELGWGTHERHWPADGHHHETGSQCAIYLKRPGASTRVRTWTPLSGPFHAFLITHTESVSIADYFTLKENNLLRYRPTVHFAYHPCEDAVLSLHEFAGKEWTQQQHQRVMFDEITDGMDELGVLLMGNQKGAYWFGSQLTIHEARKLAPYNNATSLQVAIGALSGMIWAMEHPELGIVDPDEIDFEYILNIAGPYLGKVAGYYTDWNPLNHREKLFPEHLDKSDPWQFQNIRVY
ncbi:Homospermidine synthase [Aquicella siphonis]|uniref:Homospermidine synthase n=1 Tax=Aquicella siphonis TaxID=254247 RepID=A0A5E4PF49_9COXI|nr:saccharopine dehydrogenase C-terminal domain-containing protein [Aquicella siphonis]VVC74981.1 Homospermidine synthase [Aquicella siphonis]